MSGLTTGLTTDLAESHRLSRVTKVIQSHRQLRLLGQAIGCVGSAWTCRFHYYFKYYYCFQHYCHYYNSVGLRELAIEVRV